MLRLVCLLSLLAGSASAQPGVPPLTGRVVDLAEIIDPTLEDVVVAQLAAFEDSTGHQLAVLTIPSLEGEALQPFATEVFRSWGLGDADRDDGVLLLVARDDRKIRIEVGYGLEGQIPDALAARIIRDEMTPRFRGGDFGGGISGAVGALTAAAAGEFEPQNELVDVQQIRPFADYKPWLQGGWWAHLMFVLAVGGLMVWLALRSLAREALSGRLLYGVLATAALVFVQIQLDSRISMFAEIQPATGGLVAVIRGLLKALIVVFPVAFLLLDRYLARAPAYASLRKRREAIQRASRSGERSVSVDGKTYRVPKWNASTSFSGGGYSGGSYSGGSSSGGFSGGGGSSGGGGASGSW